MIKAHIIQITKSLYNRNWRDILPPTNIMEVQGDRTTPFYIICDLDGSENMWYIMTHPDNRELPLMLESAFVYASNNSGRSVILIQGPYTKEDVEAGIEFIENHSMGPV